MPRTKTPPRAVPKADATTSDGMAILRRRFLDDDPEMAARVEEEYVNSELSSLVHALRTGAGLTQGQLAKKVGTTQSVISRLEDADYDGHSLAMLRRIAKAVGHVVEIRVIPVETAR
jgi:ribosome-binding protein aMBF1 (putative translation factor)